MKTPKPEELCASCLQEYPGENCTQCTWRQRAERAEAEWDRLRLILFGPDSGLDTPPCVNAAKGQGFSCAEHKVAFQGSAGVWHLGELVRCPVGQWQEFCRREGVGRGRLRSALLAVMRVGARKGFSYAPTLATHGVDMADLGDDGKDG
jgi:hypothetical protein